MRKLAMQQLAVIQGFANKRIAPAVAKLDFFRSPQVQIQRKIRLASAAHRLDDTQ